MEKKTECEIVQDLLPSYLDGVLNKTSKKLVESHLAECKKCRERLESMQKETTKEAEEKIEKEIDYLKKYRLMARIKTIVGVLSTLLIIFFIWYGYKLAVITKLTNQYQDLLEEENIYIETITADQLRDILFIDKTWYKDGKYKKETYQRKEGEEERLVRDTEYGEIGNKQRIEVKEKDKTATKINYPWKTKKQDIISYGGNIKEYNQTWFLKLGAPFHKKITTDTYKIGREYYVLKEGNLETWMDKKTGFPILEMGRVTSTQYYEGTKIEKEIGNSTTEYRYEVGKVTEKDVTMPDLGEYEVQENNYLVDLVNEANSKLSSSGDVK